MIERKALDAKAFSLMLGLTALWGFQQVAIKLTAPDISLVMQAGLRSVIATALLLAWAQWRGTPLFARDGTLGAGVAAGLLFGGEFIFIYGGLEHTAASRMVVFIYLAPVLTALGLHWLVPGREAGAHAVGGSAGGLCRHRARLRRRLRRGTRLAVGGYFWPGRRAAVGGDHGADPRHRPGAHQRGEDACSTSSWYRPRCCSRRRC